MRRAGADAEAGNNAGLQIPAFRRPADPAQNARKNLLDFTGGGPKKSQFGVIHDKKEEAKHEEEKVPAPANPALSPA